MSERALDLKELVRLNKAGGTPAGALIEKLLRATANALIQSGTQDFRLGC